MPKVTFSDLKPKIVSLAMGDTLLDINDSVYMVSHVGNSMYILSNLETGNCVTNPLNMTSLIEKVNYLNMVLTSISVQVHGPKRNLW